MPHESRDSYVKPERKGEKSIKVTTAPVRLKQNVKGQNRTGIGRRPY